MCVLARIIVGIGIVPGGGGLSEKQCEPEQSDREFIVLGILAVFVLLLGLWPAPLVEMMNATIEQLVLQVSQGKL